VGDRGEALDVATEDVSDELGLGLAQLGELVGDVGDGAVLLAQLFADRALTDRGSVTAAGQRLGQRLRRCELGLRGRDVVVVALELGDASAGERQDGVVPAGLGQEAEGAEREIVVLLVEAVATGLGEGEDLRRAASAAVAVDAGLTGLDGTLGDHLVEVPADRGGRQLQPIGERGCGARTELEDRPGHPLTGGGVDLSDFHNTIVSLLGRPFK
jgi:hypothetical protein